MFKPIKLFLFTTALIPAFTQIAVANPLTSQTYSSDGKLRFFNSDQAQSYPSIVIDSPGIPLKDANGNPYYTYSIQSQNSSAPTTFPQGITYDSSTGYLTGTNVQQAQFSSNTYRYAVQADDSTPYPTKQNIEIVYGRQLGFRPATLPNAIIGFPYISPLTSDIRGEPIIPTFGNQDYQDVSDPQTCSYIDYFNYQTQRSDLPQGLSLIQPNTGDNTNNYQIIVENDGSNNYNYPPGVYAFQLAATCGNDYGSGNYIINVVDPTDQTIYNQTNAQISASHRLLKVQNDNIVSHLEQVHDKFDEGCEANDGINLWTTGGTSSGSHKSDGARNKFKVKGFTVGIDKAFHENFLIGAAIGAGTDHVKLDSMGSRVRGTDHTGSVYATLRPTEMVFIDAITGYSHIDLKNTRIQLTDQVLLRSKRKAPSYFSSIIASLHLTDDKISFNPFIRADFNSSNLKSSNESDNSSSHLNFNFNGLKTRSSSIYLGAYTSYKLETEHGLIKPFLKVQVGRSSNRNNKQSLYLPYYCNLFNRHVEYNITVNPLPKEIATAEIGMEFTQNKGIDFRLAANITKGSRSYTVKGATANLSIKF